MIRKFIAFTICLIGFGYVFGQNPGAANRSSVEEGMAPFYHGVASGDPLPNAVIIWTRITTQDASANVEWTLATDTNLTQVVKSGSLTTDAAVDFTVKVDVTGLSPDTWYYYGFKHGSDKSITGRTKTAPNGARDQLRFAVVSCSDYQNGFFNAYERLTMRNDIDAVLHLGDYIYEYGSSSSVGRFHEPANEIITLSDYRTRHSQYKLDADLRLAHQQYPWVVTWDDHETANDSYKDGADNHTPATEGDWETRKNYGKQAYFEWMPIRVPDTAKKSIYRDISYGSLAELIVLDTRLEGRDKQNGTNSTDTNRTILGQEQYQWLLNKLQNSTAKWKIIVQQVMFAPLEIFGLAVNADQWDGYKLERQKIVQFLKDNNIENVVILTGDIHTSWGNEVYLDKGSYDSATGAGSYAVEFVTTSITSANSPIPVPASVLQSQNKHMKYIDLTNHGYILLDLTNDKVQADWFYTNIDKEDTTERFDAGYFTNANESFLQNAAAPSVFTGAKQPFAPIFRSLTAVDPAKTAGQFVMLNSFPNPFEDRMLAHYYVPKPSVVKLRVVDPQGKIYIDETLKHDTQGVYYVNVGLDHAPAGAYFLILETDGKVVKNTIIKTR